MIRTIILSLLIATIWVAIASQFVWNATNSACPVGFYRKTDKKPARGDLVLLRNPLKEYAAGPGDTITTTAEGSYINGKLFQGSGIPEGTPYRPYPYSTFVLAEDQYWMLGHNPLSLDSRYQGPIPGCELWQVVKPW